MVPVISECKPPSHTTVGPDPPTRRQARRALLVPKEAADLVHGVRSQQCVNSAILQASGAKSIDVVTHSTDDFTLLQITPALDAGGVEQATLDMAGAVAGRGLALAGRFARRPTGGPRWRKRGGQLVRLPLHARDPLSLAANAARLIGGRAPRRVSLIHVRSRAPAFSALLAARATGAPMVATYHGIYGARDRRSSAGTMRS